MSGLNSQAGLQAHIGGGVAAPVEYNVTAEPTYAEFYAQIDAGLARHEASGPDIRDLQNALCLAENRAHEVEVALDWMRQDFAEAREEVARLKRVIAERERVLERDRRALAITQGLTYRELLARVEPEAGAA